MKPIFIIRLPHGASPMHLDKMYNSPNIIELRKDYHVLVVRGESKEILFELYNATDLNIPFIDTEELNNIL